MSEQGNANVTLEIEAIDIVEERAAIGQSTFPLVIDTMPQISSLIGLDRYPTVRILVRRAQNERLRAIVGTTLGACVTIVAVAAACGSRGEPAATRVAASTSSLPTPPEPPAPARASVDSTPWVTVSPGPFASFGTVEVAAGVTWPTLDTKRLSARSTVVVCGPHQLRFGRSAPRNVVVPCGGTLEVARSGAVAVR